MQPMGRKPVRFPHKVDMHPTNGRRNWWEVEPTTESKKRERAEAKRQIQSDLRDIH